jgi:hypothetical protein
MIEPLESRTFFSAAPPAAFVVLRRDVAALGQTFKNMAVANRAAINNLNSDVSIFPTTSANDKALLRHLNFQFVANLATLRSDLNTIKTLFAEDIQQLMNKSNAYSRNPTAAAGQAVQTAEQQLTAEGIAASTTLSKAASLMKGSALQALALVNNAHPIDSTLTLRISHVTSAFTANIQAIQTVGNTVVVTDIPNLITAVAPSGVVTA